MRESDLYAPIKAFLEQQGYSVKGEIGACDLVAVRGDEAPLVVELKRQLNLSVVLQAVDRLQLADAVYIAFFTGRRHSATWRSRRKQVIALLRRLGIGLLTVSTRGRVEPVLDPGPYQPRPRPQHRQRLLKEFHERVGDPEPGGSGTRQRLTAYRQDALRCAALLEGHTQAVKVAEVRDTTGVERAGAILRDNHYGWFERAERGHYALSPKGQTALTDWAGALETLLNPPSETAENQAMPD